MTVAETRVPLAATGPPQRKRLSDRYAARFGAHRGALLLCILVVSYLVLGPFVISIIATFRPSGVLPLQPGEPFTLENYRTAFTDPRTWATMWNTLLFALGSLAVATGLALAFSWLLERTDLRGRSVIFALIVAPIAIPGMLVAIAYIFVLDPRIGILNLSLRWLFRSDASTGPLSIYSLYGMIIIEGLRMTPSVFLMVSASFRGMDPSLEEASRVSGRSTAGTIRSVTLPLMRPAIFAAMLYYFMVAVEAFEVPGVLGPSAGRFVFSTAVYDAVHPPSGGLPDYGIASTLSLVLVGMSMIAVAWYARFTRNARTFVTITGKGFRPQRLALGRWGRRAAWVLCAVYISMALLMPIGILMWSSLQAFYSPPSWETLSQLSFKNYVSLLDRPELRRAAWNTAVLAVVTATAAMVIALAVGWLTARLRTRGARLLDMLTFVPHGVASIVFALGVLLMYISFRNPLYGTVYIISLALIGRYLAYTTRIANAGVLQLDPALEEVSFVAGAGWLRTYRRILLPLLAPVFFNGWVWVLLNAARDLSAPLMLYAPTNTVISTQIWNLWQTGQSGVASALGVMLITSLVTVTWLARKIFSWRSVM